MGHMVILCVISRTHDDFTVRTRAVSAVNDQVIMHALSLEIVY